MSTVDKAVESYIGALNDSDATRLRFFHGLWKLQDGLTADASPYAVPSKEEANQAAEERVALFSRHTPHVELESYLGAVSKVADYVADAAGLSDDQVEALRSVDFAAIVTADDLASAPADVSGFLETVYGRLVGDDDAAPASGLAPAVFVMVAVAALTPLIAGAATDARRAIDISILTKTTPQECPVCGQAAAMSFVGERSSLQGGDRKLWCGFCHTKWPFARIRCARCGTPSSNALRYTHPEEEPGHRIHLCDACHGYIRTVFHDEVEHIISPVVEDVVTSHLHIIAGQLGYTEAGDGTKFVPVESSDQGTPVDFGGAF